MALSEDQKAMLRLLAQREQGYDDLAALMGLSVEEVRSKVRDALAQLEAEGEPAPDVPAPPAPAEPAVPEPAAPAPEETETAAQAEPQASEEEPPPAPAKPARKPAPEPAPAATEAAPRRQGPKLSLPQDRGVQAAIGAGLLVVIAVVVLLIVGGSGGGSGESPTASGPSGEGGAANVAENSQLTQAVLSPVGGGEGEGRAIFGRVKKNVVLQVEASGLEPSPQGSSYTIWLYKSPQLALRVGAVRVGKSGGIAVQLPIPTELLAYVASGAFDQVDVSLTEDSAYAAEVAKSKREKRLPEHVGTSVLRGQITGPAIEQAAKESGG